MDSNEILKIRKLKYLDLCSYLQNKYGLPKANYFLTKACKTKNKEITRTKEGLFIHHIYEYMFPDLSKHDMAILNPYSYQHKENLVYCNYIEHLILHFDIVKEYLKKDIFLKTRAFVGLGGLVNFIAPSINDCYSISNTFMDWKKDAANVIKDNKEDYFDIIYEFEKYCRVYKLNNEFRNELPYVLKENRLYNITSLSSKEHNTNDSLLKEYNNWRIRTYLPKYKLTKKMTLLEITKEYKERAWVIYDDIKNYLSIDENTGYFKYIGPEEIPSTIRSGIDLLIYFMLQDKNVIFV